MMGIKNINKNNFVPKNYITRKIYRAIHLSFIYDKARDFYSMEIYTL